MPAFPFHSTSGTSRPRSGCTNVTRADVTTRDYDTEHKGGARQYAYKFDTVLRRYIMRALDSFEASGELVASASARLGPRATFVHGTFETVDLADRYDAIFLVHTLEHLDDPVAVLRRVNDWLTDEGRLAVVVPNANAASRQI